MCPQISTAQIKCPNCSSRNVHVTDSRGVKTGEWVRRRRACRDCEAKFTTREFIELKDTFVRATIKQTKTIRPQLAALRIQINALQETMMELEEGT